MSATERFIRYAKIDTQSDPYSGKSPSTDKQFDLAKLLVEELKEMGIEATMSAYGYVYAHIASNIDQEVETVGFIAHMDTAPDYSGTGVNPRVIESYDGKDIPLSDTMTMKVSDFPQLPSYVGEKLIVTDGTTLLGADDKAGITAIMEAVSYYVNHPEVKHGRIAIAFTPDEEIGEGTKHFDLETFDAGFAFTLDGGDINYYADETFNASAAKITVQGFSIHPGSAKDKMINAASVITEYNELLPKWMRPEHTEKHEGFIHLTNLSGNTDHAVAEYILRDHDANALAKQKEIMETAAAHIRNIYGDIIMVEIRDQYRNMNEILKDRPEIAEMAFESMREIGLDPEFEIVRGGTDGCMLTFMGLPCPNLGTGGGNAHGPYEYLVVSQMEKGTELVLKIVEKVANR